MLPSVRPQGPACARALRSSGFWGGGLSPGVTTIVGLWLSEPQGSPLTVVRPHSCLIWAMLQGKGGGGVMFVVIISLANRMVPSQIQAQPASAANVTAPLAVGFQPELPMRQIPVQGCPQELVFLLRTAPRDRQPPTANRPPPTTNRHQPPTANQQPLPTANHFSILLV